MKNLRDGVQDEIQCNTVPLIDATQGEFWSGSIRGARNIDIMS